MHHPPLSSRPLSSLSLLLSLLLNPPPAQAFVHMLNRTLCCETALQESASHRAYFPINFAHWNSLVRPNGTIPQLLPPTSDNTAWNALVSKRSTQFAGNEYPDFRCGAVYSSANGFEVPAAMPVRVQLAWARRTPACMGFVGVPLGALDIWAGPVIGFLLPAVVFGLSIPTGWALTFTEVLRMSNFLQLNPSPRMRLLLAPVRAVLRPVVILATFLVLGILETLRWSIVILTCAGPILSSALHEMRLDHILLSQLELPPPVHCASSTTQLRHRSILLAILLSNVFDPDGTLLASAHTAILHAPAPQARAHLTILLAAHIPFDAAVGVPVAFYTVAYAYALFDANKRLGDILTTGALTFGLWYSEFVLVAVVSVVRQPLFLVLKSMIYRK